MFEGWKICCACKRHMEGEEHQWAMTRHGDSRAEGAEDDVHHAGRQRLEVPLETHLTPTVETPEKY